ncbi:PrpF domain-containing protein [Cryptosporangium phraense]|uniref:4-oxalomesaconate tautomerase n=1 Tax=Cryptosporangium phraense TaxID=2593070 RepID=A0A545AID6_9ACTN|nr:PrpF domain-containing protein [Cryptosporangium phraense]TQS41087.1 4-oxalomesaconate tautomerase [Cryptosporangium phraense]
MSGTDGVRFMLMRGGTSKGAYFLAEDLPSEGRDELLLRLFGSPDERQVDGLGGGHPLTSKAAVVSRTDDGVDYLFLQIRPDSTIVAAGQPCGNILAGIAPFAVERGLVEAGPETTTVRIRMVNTGGLAVVTIRTPGGRPCYDGDTVIAGVPFPAAPVEIRFADTAGAVCGALLPTGHPRDDLDGTPATLVDDGMPVVVLDAADLGLNGDEAPADLEADEPLRERIEALRKLAGERMGLGDVTAATVPKMTLVSPPRHGGTLTTRTFIPHRVHPAIGVLAAVTVARAATLEGSVAADVRAGAGERIRIEHPTGFFDVHNGAVISTARKIADGVAWPREA